MNSVAPAERLAVCRHPVHQAPRSSHSHPSAAQEASAALGDQAVQAMHAARVVSTDSRGLNNPSWAGPSNTQQNFAFPPAPAPPTWQMPSASQARQEQPPSFVPFPIPPPPPVVIAPPVVTRDITVAFQVVLSKKKDPRGSSLGTSSRSYPSDTQMDGE